MRTKLLAFAVSSFYCGVAGALYAFCYLGSVEPDGFSLDLSFRILFMIIIGGVGSILGSFLGAAFILLLPIFLDNACRRWRRCCTCRSPTPRCRISS
jgi:branched-chain amino acid transport system permease protein